jgi:hypothetical protein
MLVIFYNLNTSLVQSILIASILCGKYRTERDNGFEELGLLGALSQSIEKHCISVRGTLDQSVLLD